MPGLVLLWWISASFLTAQTASEPDTLIFQNGDRLTGRLLSATGVAIIFQSDVAGNVTVAWGKLKEVHSSRKFTAIRQSFVLPADGDTSQAPHGTLAFNQQNLEIRKDAQSPSVSIPLSALATVVDDKEFAEAFERKPFWSAWKGAASAGFAMMQGTQEFRNVNVDFQAAYTAPSAVWMQRRTRTRLSFQETYGHSMDQGESIRMSAFNAVAERDYFLKPRFYLFGVASFEHNNALGLDLRQNYGGGAGYVVIQGERQSWEVWAALRFSDQRFSDQERTGRLFGARIGQTYTRKTAKGIVFSEQAGIAPAFTGRKSYFGGYSLSLTLPIYRRLGANISCWDQYISNAPPWFKKNWMQLNIGASYLF
jgi:putative salt-induced outer membrane protein YdiY